jgi:phosphatidate phosphatase LPIN
MPFVGRDWSHRGIAEFYTNLEKNNYLIVYLTARNFGLARKTLAYLHSVKQKGFQLPEGPLILSPDSMYQAFKREIIVGGCFRKTNDRQSRGFQNRSSEGN